ncbi:hypothetical protein V6N12_057127 [Hibiscus sabdariffa]|uniref:Uncharacterized protein n=1 Tax=Hibiscus sabdariffa TaxID=183260 RepID=A0ABR2AUX8_9ROSI
MRAFSVTCKTTKERSRAKIGEAATTWSESVREEIIPAAPPDEEDFSEDSVQDWYLGITDGEKMVLDKLVRYLQLSMDLLRAIHHIKWHKDALQTLFSKLGELGSQVVEEEENLGIKFEFLTLEDRATLESTLTYCPFLNFSPRKPF